MANETTTASTKRAKTEYDTLTVASGDLGNTTPEPMEVKVLPAAKTRFNVTGQTQRFMAAVEVFKNLNQVTTAELVNTAVANHISFTERPLTVTKPKGAQTPEQREEAELSSKLLAMYKDLVASGGTPSTEALQAQMAALMASMNANDGPDDDDEEDDAS